MAGGTGVSGLQLKSYNFTTGKVGEPLLLFNPSDLASQLANMARSIAGFDGLTNSLTYVPRGRTPSHGWFLTTHREIEDKLPRLFAHGREDVRVRFVQEGEEIGDSESTAYSSTADFTVNNLLAVGAYAITGIPEPEDSSQRAGTDIESILKSPATNWENQFYVVHVTDWRYTAHLSMVTDATNTRNRYWEGLTSSSSTDQYLRGDNTDWEDTIQTLWNLLPTGEGEALDFTDATYPSSSYPWNEKFWGMTAWDALWSVLDQSNNTIVRNLAGTYSVKQFGSVGTNVAGTVSREGAAEEQTTHVGDLISISNNLGGFTIPEKIRVVFPKWDYQWQTSADPNEVTAQDYWHNRPVWYYEVATGDILTVEATGDTSIANRIVPGSKKLLHSSTFAQFKPRTNEDYGPEDSVDDKAVPVNASELENDATSRATNYLNTFTKDVEILDKTYRGFVPFTPTHALSSILWADSGSSGPITRIMNLPRNQEGKLDRVESAVGDTSTGGGGGGPSATYDPQVSSSQRVANEFPGSPDHARMEEPVLRWAVVKLEYDCHPEGEVSAKVEFGIPQASDAFSGDAGNQMILWYESGEASSVAKTINVTNLSRRDGPSPIMVEAGTRVVAFWNEQIRKWVFIPPGAQGKIKSGEICADVNGNTPVIGGAHAGDRNMDAFGHAIVTGYTHDVCIDPTAAIRVNKDTHLSTYVRAASYEETDCLVGGSVTEEMLISIDPSIDTGGSVFWSDGNHVRWTKAPNIGKEILLGDGKNKLDPPRLRFQHSETATHAIPAALTDFYAIICRAINTGLVTKSGEGTGAPYVDETTSINQEIILPNDTDAFSVGQHLSIKSTGGDSDPNCLKLRWTSPGVFPVGNGGFTVITEVDFVSGTTKERTLYFDDGVLIGVTNPDTDALEGADWYRTDAEDANCNYVVYAAPDPCHGSYYGTAGGHAGEGPFGH